MTRLSKPRWFSRSVRWTTCIVLGVLLFAPVACGVGGGTSTGHQGDGGGGGLASFVALPVSFSATMSYEQALRELTDAGYQPTVACGFQSDISAGQVIEGLRWQPAGQRDRFNYDHVMFVLDTPLAAPGPNPWANLDTLPGVITENQHTTVTCPSLETGPTNITPQPGVTTVFIPSELASPSYARVSFSTTVDYDAALLEVTDLGVRLGDYCYETGLAASNHGKTLWHPMGQEGEYASSHTLTLAPMALTTAHTWLDQLGAIPGVTGVQANYTPTC